VDLPSEPVRDRLDVRHVLVADEHERRRLDLAEAIRHVFDQQLLVVLDRSLELERAPLHLGDSGANTGIDILELAAWAGDPRPESHVDCLVAITLAQRRLLLSPGRAHFARPVVPGQA
jgi:hypothetical protein